MAMRSALSAARINGPPPPWCTSEPFLIIQRAMSSRAADGVRDEIETRGRIKRSDVEAAQQQIVAVAKRLAAEGAIVIGDGGGDDEYV